MTQPSIQDRLAAVLAAYEQSPAGREGWFLVPAPLCRALMSLPDVEHRVRMRRIHTAYPARWKR